MSRRCASVSARGRRPCSSDELRGALPGPRPEAREARRRARRRLLRAARAARRRSTPRSAIGAAQLAADADALLAELEDGWLADQVHGCATYAHVLAGEHDLLQRRGRGLLRRAPRSESPRSVYEEVHAKLDELLPGDGSLFERRQAWRERHRCPGDQAVAVLDDLVPVLRARTSALLELPAGEELSARARPGRAVVGVQLLPGQPAQPGRAEHRRADLGARSAAARRARGLPGPPHRARAQGAAARCASRAASRRGSSSCPRRRPCSARASPRRGSTSSSTTRRKEEAYAIIRRHGIQLDDPDLVEQIAKDVEGLGTVGVDAALMIHEDGASVAEAEAYVEKWSLVTVRTGAAERALHHRSDLARLRDHLHGGPRALPRLHRAAIPRDSGRCSPSTCGSGDLVASV